MGLAVPLRALKVRDRNTAAVYIKLEVVGPQAAHWLAASVHNDYIDFDKLNI
jgi:hypothetical protein